MATHSPTYLALKFNALLDGQTFFDHWSEKFRSPQVYGFSVKCLCPFHLGESFRSLLLDLRKKTFRCTFTACKASGGGTFADLHSFFLDKPLLEALLDLRSTFRLELPEDVQHPLAAALADQAREHLRARELETAENVAALAFKEDPTNTPLRLLLAEICEASNRSDDARPYYELALEQAVADRNWNQAGTILNRLRTLYPDQMAYVEQSLKAAQGRGDPAGTVTAYLELGRRSDVSLAQRQEWLEQARALDPGRPEILEQLGGVYEDIQRHADAVKIWESLAENYRRSGQWQQALEVLDRIARQCPQREDIRETRAEILLAAGREGEATDILNQLVAQALEQGATEQAERYLQRLCDSHPSDIETSWQLLTLLEQTGRVEEATRVAERVLAVCDPALAGDRYAAVLERLKNWYPNDTVYRGRLVAHYANRGNTDAAFNELCQLMELYFQKGLRTDALQHVEAMRSLVVDHPRRRLELAQLLVTHECTAEALREYEAVARACLTDNPDLAEEACTHGLEVDPSQIALHEIHLEIVLANRPDQAVEECRRLIELYRAQGLLGKSLVAPARVKQHLPKAVEPRLLLVRLATEIGRPDRAVAELEELVTLELSDEQAAEALQAAGALAEQTSQPERLRQVLARLGAPLEAEPSPAGGEPEEKRVLQAADLVALIELAVRTGQAPEATRLFARALELEPKNVNLHERYIRFLTDQKRTEEVRRALEALADLLCEADDPNRVIGNLSAAVADFPRAAILHDRLGDFHLTVNAKGRARACFKKAVQLFEESGDKESARVAAEKVLVVDPPDMTMRAFLVESLDAAGQVDQAHAHARALAAYYADRDLFDLAEREYRRIVAREPDNLGAWMKVLEMIECMGRQKAHLSDYFLVAQLSSQRGLLDQAAQIYRQIIGFDPGNLEARRAYIETRLEAGTGTELVPDFLEFADLLATRGNTDEAITLYRQVLALHPDNAHAQAQLGTLQSGQKPEEPVAAEAPPPPAEDVQAALRQTIENYKQILETNPDNALIRGQMADMLFQLGDAEAALKEWDQAAVQFAERSEFDQVQRLCEKILQVDSDNARARERLSRATLWKHSMHELDRAIESFEEGNPLGPE